MDPESDLLRANTLHQWCKWLKIIDDALKKNNFKINSLFLGYQSGESYFENDSDFFYGLSKDYVFDLISESKNFRLNGSDAVNVRRVKNILSFHFNPDIIISIGDAKYLECVFPDAKIIHIEMAPFYRLMNSGLRFCVTFSDWMKLSDVVSSIPYLDDCNLSDDVLGSLSLIKAEICQKNRDFDVNLKIEYYKKYFKKICIIPLAETHFSPLKLKLFDLISEFMEKSDKNELYILTDHPLAIAITDSELLELKSRYSNILSIRNDFGDYSTINFYELCDVVYTDFSNASVDSLFFNGIEYRSLLAGLDINLGKYLNFRNPLSAYMPFFDRSNLDKILYLILKYYTISPSKFFDGLWWSHLIFSSGKTTNLSDIEERLG